jgi:hypothetical protein
VEEKPDDHQTRHTVNSLTSSKGPCPVLAFYSKRKSSNIIINGQMFSIDKLVLVYVLRNGQMVAIHCANFRTRARLSLTFGLWIQNLL